ncbi:hypothetical protein LG047_05820 [Methylocystis sp. WRRC1]|uniref:hypothetical protein n=1 Tax=Methylocystis sp. WRRC1 TaxID=1732014 RepID=UPI001D156CA7|nr:hypothetical protein [Methylocystis sp. WRRC1]MCC3244838.1 hypothetical protein [Methylocystis sp. WRRC1]
MYHVMPVEATKGARMSKFDQLNEFIEALSKRLEVVKAQREQLAKGIESCDSAIATIEKGLSQAIQLRENIGPEFLETLEGIYFPKLPEMTSKAPMPAKELTPKEVADHARSALLDAKRPMKRGALVRELERRGVPLAGRDKNKNLGTILWRHADQFVSLPKLGYWVKDVPLEGVYSPESRDTLADEE